MAWVHIAIGAAVFLAAAALLSVRWRGNQQ